MRMDQPAKPKTLDDGPDSEVRAGLPNEQNRLLEALLNQAYYDGENERLIPRRQAETDADYEYRPKRTLELVTQAVDALVKDGYSPAPTRTLEEAAEANTWLEGVYADQQVDATMSELDTLATVNGVAALQLSATGDDERPMKFLLWGAEEFAVWTETEDPTTPWAVVTIDRQDEQTRYKLWDATDVRTYLSEKVLPGQTAGGRRAAMIDRQPHDYGRLPFAFWHYKRPTRKFWADGPGCALRRANTRVDVRLSELDEAIEKYNLRPYLYAIHVDPKFRPVHRPGSFQHLTGSEPRSISGDPQPEPQLKLLQAVVDAAGAWADITEFVYAKLETVGVPRSAVRMEQTGVSSGIALVIEQAPMLKRAMQRRAHLRRTETDIAKAVLECGGSHYGNPALVTAAQDVRLSMIWPEPYIPFPDPVRNQIDQQDVAMGLKSIVQICMQRYDLTEDQALAHLERVAEQNKKFDALHPELAAQPGNQPAGSDPALSTTNPNKEPDDSSAKSDVQNGEADL